MPTKGKYNRKAKTKEYVVKGNYGQGWEIVYTGENRQDAKDRFKEYCENEPQYAHRLGWVYV